MDSSELDAIRQARLAELQKQSGGPGSSAGPADDAKYSMLSQILEPSARERLSRVRIVRPDRAEAVEQYIMRLASSGGISRKLGEKDIVEILDGLSRDEKRQTQSKIVFDRKDGKLDFEPDKEEEEEEDDFFD